MTAFAAQSLLPSQPIDNLIADTINDDAVAVKVEACGHFLAFVGSVAGLGGVALIKGRQGVTDTVLAKQLSGFFGRHFAPPNQDGIAKFLAHPISACPVTEENFPTDEDGKVIAEGVMAQNRFVGSGVLRQPLHQSQVTFPQVKRHSAIVQGDDIALEEIANLTDPKSQGSNATDQQQDEGGASADDDGAGQDKFVPRPRRQEAHRQMSTFYQLASLRRRRQVNGEESANKPSNEKGMETGDWGLTDEVSDGEKGKQQEDAVVEGEFQK
jgi:hypothetical protein